MHRRRTHCLRVLLLVGAAALLRCSPSFAAEQPQEQESGPPRLAAARVDTPPVLDGILDDASWQAACHVEGFWREDLDAPEFEPTEAWISYDSRTLYVAFRCHDSQPSEIRAVQTKRQGSMGNDDRVTVRLDVEDAGRNEYQFRVNALGTQSDEVPGGTSEKIEWKGDWRAAARIDDAGWSAEMAIPFSILRYPDGQRSFRVVLQRRLAREDDDSVWPPEYARIRDSESCARLTDIAAPAVPFRYVLMPYLLSVLSEDEEGRETLTGGLDFKGTFPNSVVALGTYNPDFYNLEDVVESIDFTFVERYLPEYRPFFQEGSGYMPSGEEWDPVNILYTRRIEKLDWGAKTFGTVGPHRFGVLDAYRRGGENHVAWNYDYLIDTNGSFDFSGVDRRVPGEPDNQAYSLGSHWHFPYPGGHRSFGGDWYQSRTDGEGGDDEAFSIDASVWPQQGFGGWIGYNAIGANFQADDGYVPETGVRSLSVGLSHERSYDEGPLFDTHWDLSADSGDSNDGARRSVHLSHGRSWRSGWEAFAGLTRGERDGYDVIGNSLGLQWNHRDSYRRGGLHVAYGEHYAEPYRYQSISQAFRGPQTAGPPRSASSAPIPPTSTTTASSSPPNSPASSSSPPPTTSATREPPAPASSAVTPTPTSTPPIASASAAAWTSSSSSATPTPSNGSPASPSKPCGASNQPPPRRPPSVILSIAKDPAVPCSRTVAPRRASPSGPPILRQGAQRPPSPASGTADPAPACRMPRQDTARLDRRTIGRAPATRRRAAERPPGSLTPPKEISRMRDRMQEALRDSGADYAEIRIERAERTDITFRGPELDEISSSSSLGGVARALVNGGWGIVTFNDLSDLRSYVQEAVASARLVGKDTSQLAEAEPFDRIIPPPDMKRDFRGVPLAEKQQTVKAYNDIMLGRHPKIQSTNTRYFDRYREVYFANSQGSYFEETRPDLSLALIAIARDGNLIQRAHEGMGRAAGFDAVLGLEAKAEASAQRAADLLSAPPVRGGNYTVITNQKLGGVFAHEAFGHLSEADAVYENEHLRDLMVLGKRFGPDHLNIIDDGSYPGGRGTHPLDDEGVPTRENYLIKDGILVGRLHNRETAGKMGESVTGNARAIAWEFPPIVRMTNTYIAPGASTFAGLIQDVDLGIYACDMIGGQTMGEMFTFSAAHGYMIRKGEVAELVRDIVLTGNVFQTLQDIDLIADDLAWTEGSGGCGKGGQSPLPVGLGSPHIRIQGVVVGGQQ